MFEAPTNAAQYHDFVKRVAVIRELYEECNLLLATTEVRNPEVTLERYESIYKDNFSEFCSAHNLIP